MWHQRCFCKNGLAGSRTSAKALVLLALIGLAGLQLACTGGLEQASTPTALPSHTAEQIAAQTTTNTPVPTATQTSTPTWTPTATSTAMPTETPTLTATPTQTPTKTPTKTPTPTLTPAQAAAEGAALPSDQVVELDLWHTKTGLQEALLDEIVADFNASNPYNIQVNTASIAGGYDQIYRETIVGLAAGEAPDLVVAYPSMVSEYVVFDAPLDLRPYIRDTQYGLTEEELGDLYPVYIEDNSYPTYGDQILSWPFHKSVLVMYANVTLLNEAGVGEMPETWEELYAACQAVKANTNAETCWSIHVDPSEVNGLMASVGVYPQADPETLTSQMDDPRFVEFMQFLQKMVDEGMACPEAERYSGDDEMAAGNAAFTTASSSGLFYFPQNDDGSYAIEWRVIALPHAAGGEGASIVYGANVMAIREDDPERNLAKWLFIKYWGSDAAMKKWVLGTGEISGSSYLPLHRSMLENPGFVAYLDENPRYAEAVGLLKSGVIEPQLAGQQEVRGILEDVYLAVLRGEDVPTILKDAALRATQVYHRWDR